MEDQELISLRNACKSQGAPPLNRLRDAQSGRYTSDEVEFLDPYLDVSPENIQILILTILCNSGFPVSRYLDRLGDLSSKMSSCVIKIAEQQHDPLTIVTVAQNNRKNIHAAVLALKNIGETRFLNNFAFDASEELSHLIGEVNR